MASDKLISEAKVVLAQTFTFYFQAHSYHWNIIGKDFPQLHAFFDSLYNEVHDAVDTLAEQIRQLNPTAYAPVSLSRIIELYSIETDDRIPNAQNMISNLISANALLLETLASSYELAEEEKEYGYSNVLQDRISAHKKWQWQLEAQRK